MKNFVTITGDIHSFVAGYQKVNFDNLFEPAVSVCFVGGSVTSSNFVEVAASGGSIGGRRIQPSEVDYLALLVKLNNPHINFFNSSEHGYNLIEVTPEALTCTMKVVETIKQPQANISILKVFRVPRDQVLIQDLSPELTAHPH